MNATELFPALRNLSRDEKIKALKFLEQELQSEEDQKLLQLLQPGATYEIWSPFNSHEAAQTLAKLLEDTEQHD